MRSFTILSTILFLVGACSNDTPEPTEPVAPVRTHYTLEKGRTRSNRYPFPKQTEVKVDWHYSDGTSQSYIGYNLWDMNGDGINDMLEVFDPETKIATEYWMDLDFDGEFETKSELARPTSEKP